MTAEERRRWLDRTGWWAFGVTMSLCLIGAGIWMAAGAWIGAGFFAKQLCSGVFVSGRSPRHIVESDLRRYLPLPVHRYMGWKIDEHTRTVSARWMNSIGREARFTDTQGCELIYDGNAVRSPMIHEEQRKRSFGMVQHRSDRPVAASPPKAAVLPARSVAAPAVDAVVAQAFEHPASTRAVIVIHRGTLVAERYAEGFHAHTRLPGWSLSKSVMNAMIGALVQQGRLDVHAPVPISAWRGAGDGRSRVTYDDLLRMSSGLRFDENYDSPFSDVTRMLFGVADAAAYAESRPLVAAPGRVWSYSSGSTTVLAHALAAYADSPAAYRELPRRLVFRPLGMRSAVMERDASGTFEATSSVYATALDWARFGWLYASDGAWNGRRILPSGWVDYSTTPAPADASGRYGAHFWVYTEQDRRRVQLTGAGALPADAFYAEGFGGQRITISRAAQMVIVRLGADEESSEFDNTLFAARVLRAMGIDGSAQRRAAARLEAQS